MMRCGGVAQGLLLSLVLGSVSAQDYTEVKTNDGTACVFPFTYLGTTYFGCTNANNGNTYWCSYDATYVGRYGNCVATASIPTTDSTACSLPFTIENNPTYANTQFFACTSVLSVTGVPWCSTAPTFTTGQSTYRDCTSPACNSYQVIQNTYSPLGVLQGSTLNTVALCQNACSLDFTCVGLDFYRNLLRCYFHTNVNNFNSRLSASDRDQYVKQPCQGCSYNTLNGVQSPGGVQQTAATTISLCRSACDASVECQGFDFNANTNACYFHNSVANFNSRNSNANVVQYMKQECDPGCEKYDTFNAAYSQGGTAQTALVTLDACRIGCTADPTCAGLDFHSNTNTCYFHTNPTDFTARLSIATATQLTKSSECGCYTKATGVLSPNGIVTPISPGTLPQCQDACDGLGTCVGFDYNTNSNQCFLHTSSADFNSQSSNIAVDQYRKGSCASTSTTVAPGVCTDTFTVTNNKNSFGGTEISGTPTQCQTTCLAAATCVAVDVNPTTNKCWWHTAATLPLVNPNQPANLMQYVRVPCQTSGGTTVTGQPGTCVDSFSKRDRTLSYSGQELANNANLQSCQAACLAEATCTFYDFNRVNNKCWLHTASNTPAQNTNAAQIDQYTRIPCTAVSGTGPAEGTTPCSGYTFTETPMTLSYNGDIQTAANTLELCQAACVAAVTCTFLDFNPTTNRCYLHDAADTLAEKVAPSVNQYIKVPCDQVSSTGQPVQTTAASGCTDTFEVLPNTLSYSGTQNTDANTQALCQAACLANATCLAFDYTTTNACFIHTNPSYNMMVATGRPNVAQHRRIPCAATTTTAAGECVDSFDRINNTFAYGAEKFEMYNTVDSCRAYCLSQVTCVAFDYNRVRNECWIHLDISNLNNIQTGSAVLDLYRRLPCAVTGAVTGSPTPPDGCMDTFDLYAGTSSYGGTEAVGENTLAKCQEYCLALDSCVGVDYTSGNRCWYHTSVTAFMSTNVRVTPAINQYRRVPCSRTCPLLYRNYPGRQHPTAVVQTVVTSLADCKSLCDDSNSCFGYQYAAAFTPKCYISTASYNPVTDLAPNTAFSHYYKVPCDCDVEFRSYSNRQIGSAATIVAGVFTKDACQSACQFSSTCYGFEFNRATSACYSINSPYNPDTDLGSNANYDNYYRVPCECVETYTLQANTLYHRGVDAGSAADAAECQAYCTLDTACLAVDYNRVNRGCYKHTDPANLVAANMVSPTANVDHYTKVSCEPTVSTTRSPVGCEDTFNELPNTLSLGGEPSLGAMTEEQCKQQCINNGACLAIDYDSAAFGINCFIHTNQAILNSVLTVANVDQFHIVRCQVPSTTTTSTTTTTTTQAPAPIGCSMLSYGSRQGFGGVEQLGFLSAFACTDRCLRDTYCDAADYRTGDGRCFLHYALTRTVSDVGFARYEKSCNDCRETFDPRYGVQGLGGQLASGVLGVSACAQYCRTRSGCTGFDINNNNNQCYVFIGLYNTRTVSNIDNYVMRDCNVCVDTYIASQGVRQQLGQYQSGINSRGDCESLCTSTPTCRGYDWQTTGNRCYITLNNLGATFQDFSFTSYTRVPCDQPPTATPRPVTTTASFTGCVADIVLMVDTSGSITDEDIQNWPTLKNFMKQLVSRLDIGPDRVRVAIIVFSDYAETVVFFNTHDNVVSLQNAIDVLPFIGGHTYTSRAFDAYLSDLLGNANHGDRANVPDIIILITDGNTTAADRNPLSNVLNRISIIPTSQLAVRIGVGIGRIDLQMMMQIVSNPFNTNYINVNDFAALEHRLDDVLLGTSCSGVTNSPGPQPVNSGLALYVYRAEPAVNAMYPVIYSQEAVDYNFNYHTDNNVMTPPTTGVYWFSLSAGVAQYVRVFYELSGTLAQYNVAISRQHSRNNGFDTLSKDAILLLGAGATVRVNSNYGLYSDVTRQTSLSAFSISDIMGPQAVYFLAGFTSGTAGPGRLNWKTPYPLDSRNAFSQTTSEYTCQISGLYVFSLGLFVRDSSNMHAMLRIPGGDSYELRRTHAFNAGGGDTLSRNVIAYCNANTRVYVEILSGQIMGNNEYTSSFMGFLYQPVNTSPTMFSVSTDNFENRDRATITMPFNRKNYDAGNFNVPSTNIQSITCPVSGYYYLSLTVESVPDVIVNVYMDKNGENVGGIYRSSPWHGPFYDTLSRSVIVRCNLGERLSVKIASFTSVSGSSGPGVVGTNFWGMLLYQV